jgi:hypothetical protein
MSGKEARSWFTTGKFSISHGVKPWLKLREATLYYLLEQPELDAP